MVIKGGLQGQPGNPFDDNDEGVFISKINEGSVASMELRLSVGQRIIEVSGQSLLGATHAEAVDTLRAASTGNEIHVLLCDGFNKIEDESSAPDTAVAERENGSEVHDTADDVKDKVGLTRNLNKVLNVVIYLSCTLFSFGVSSCHVCFLLPSSDNVCRESNGRGPAAQVTGSAQPRGGERKEVYGCQDGRTLEPAAANLNGKTTFSFPRA
jgi:hypothetical protein